ncbi:hypothetical protein GCM10010915_11960 [Microbacterium faecale]|uniref:Uncharacterized protein n=1 Tax=Microbacterium faecale TaxID=1804630 RepID=A0A916Y6I1_9MICO|nr:hypothetical protein [Microbacterium faecale]GGD33168.1 hypothetical protein GCM10010915_11960 [Microbacterium faecale]
MAFNFGGGRSFIEVFGGTFGTKTVRVVPGPEKPEREVAEFEGVVQTKTVGFNVDTPVYEGDELTWADPRGGETTVWASKVDVSDAGGHMASELSHINVTFSKVPPSDEPHPAIGGGHTIVVSGSHVNVAVDGSRISQQISVAGGYEQLSDAVGQALALIESCKEVQADEIAVARTAAKTLLEEASKATPDEGAIRRNLPVLRGVLTAVANSTAGALASGLIGQLFI